MIYFDNNSTTPLSKQVQRYVKEHLISDFANASSEHLIGQSLKDEIEKDRQYIADFIKVSAKNILFTSGATEAINSILNPVFFQTHHIKSIITSGLEHSVVIRAVERLGQYGIKIFNVQNDKDGLICLDHLKSLVKSNPNALVTILGANNETGVCQKISEAVAISKEHDSLVHLDGVQMLGKMTVDLCEWGVDYASFSAHKIGGFKGIGLLYIRQPDKFVPFMMGGGQEMDLRGGTYNVSGIKSFRLALDDTKNWDLEKIKQLRDDFENQLQNLRPQIFIHGKNVSRICNTSNIYFPERPGQALVMALSSEGICASTGSACHTGSVEASHVIIGMGFSREYASSCVRFSFSHFNTQDEVRYTLNVLKNLT